jgi:hypothetical protein
METKTNLRLGLWGLAFMLLVVGGIAITSNEKMSVTPFVQAPQDIVFEYGTSQDCVFDIALDFGESHPYSIIVDGQETVSDRVSWADSDITVVLDHLSIGTHHVKFQWQTLFQKKGLSKLMCHRLSISLVYFWVC